MVKVNLIDVQPHKAAASDASILPSRRHSKRLSSTRGFTSDLPGKEGLVPRVKGQSAVTLGQDCGWVRVFKGEGGCLVYLTQATTVEEVCSDLALGEEETIWIQYGGGSSTRLAPTAAPLALQDAYLTSVGYTDASRRTRLGIDAALRHMIRFHTGPALPASLEGAPRRSGAVLVLKGLVFPHWKRRPVAILASKLFIYPGVPGSEPETVDLAGGEVCERPVRAGRLVLRVSPSPEGGMGGEGKHIFLGFTHKWERDVWHQWIRQGTEELSSSPSRVDLCDEGLQRLPDTLLKLSSVEELTLNRNHLGAGSHDNLSLLAQLPRLRRLHLQSNRLTGFPASLLQLGNLVHLDLSDNHIAHLPMEISRLSSLEELRVDRNELVDLPVTLVHLHLLRSLLVANNCIQQLPGFLTAMRALNILELQGNRVESNKLPSVCDEDEVTILGKVNLRANLLKGNIILGNYGNLTQLDVSENCIETLDLSALVKLESVQCSKNQLTELVLCGRSLTSLIAGNNKLRKLIITPPPTYLKHLDVSYNELEVLPGWTSGCHQLRALFASHNKLRSLPEHLFCSASGCLQTLQLSYNQLHTLPPLTHPTTLQELFLQSNNIASLPTNFFAASTRLRVLNLSNNRLYELPMGIVSPAIRNEYHQLEKFYVTANCLSDAALDVMAKFENLRTLHAAYNCFTSLPDSCIEMWQDLEELVLSGNQLQYLPENVVHLEHLRVLRVHSNRLQTSPGFATMMSLKVLDLAHNHLDRINLATLVPSQLQFLDLSCNSQLYVDPRQFQVYRTQRPMSLVDVSGHNRTCLPSVPYTEGGGDIEPPWKIGFSETAGHQDRLYVSQVRLPAFCNTEGLFALLDGGNNNDVPRVLVQAIPRILLEERTVKETAGEYMKYTMLSAHRELKENGQKYGVCATLCHITRTKHQGNGYVAAGHRYTLRVASVGEATALLCRRSGNVNMSQTVKQAASKMRSQLGCSALFPLVIPDPHVTEMLLEEQDEFLIIANKRLWEVVSEAEAVSQVRAANNAILAAKKLQDLAQGYGCEDNLSVMVIRFHGLGSDVDHLMRELRHTIHKSNPSDACRPGCRCNMHHNNFFNNGMLGEDMNICPDADRSSPSGQSDQASSENNKKAESNNNKNNRHTSVQQHNNHVRQWEAAGKKPNGLMFGGPQSVLMHENGTRKVSTGIPPMDRRSYRDSKRSAGGGVLKALRAKLDGYANGHLADAEEDETGSETQPSEEQYKCWEYMLEQNTQLLFDKELDTLSRAFARQNVARSAALLDPARSMWAPQTLRLQDRAMSRSSPHLSDPASPAAPATPPFLSKHFGSARSFNPVARNTRFGSARQLLNGGPNAAYFGSLQRIMPYNLEYNFSVIQERAGDNLDSLEHDSRMQQYWGVATTEL